MTQAFGDCFYWKVRERLYFASRYYFTASEASFFFFLAHDHYDPFIKMYMSIIKLLSLVFSVASLLVTDSCHIFIYIYSYVINANDKRLKTNPKMDYYFECVNQENFFENKQKHTSC